MFDFTAVREVEVEDVSPEGEKTIKRKRRKTFVLDTNVLLHDPAAFLVSHPNKHLMSSCMQAFGKHVVVLGMPVIEELDSFKSKSGELGNNARTIIRKLDALRQINHLGHGAVMENGMP
jgi:PhoH-like ATPase